MTCRALLCLGLSLAMAGALLPRPAIAATYYVDFDSGSDAGAGTSAEAAWKHSPGDPAAEAVAKAARLEPGDTAIFKGGVVYRGNIVVAWSGAEGKPITFDGNTAGTFGEGRAIVDGSEVLAGWKPCASADDCGGNPNWKQIVWTEAPADATPLNANLYQGERMLWLAQDPNPAEPHYQDRRSDFRPIAEGNHTRTTIVDPPFLTQTDKTFWDGALLAIWAKPNYTYYQKVTGFDPATHTISYERLPNAHYPKRACYAVMNHLRVLDTAGEFVFGAGKVPDARPRLYVWPRAEGKPGDLRISMSRRSTGFNINGRTCITVQGFVIQKFISRKPNRGAAVSNDKAGAKSIVVRDNVVRYCNKDSSWKHAGINLSGTSGGLVEGNQVHDNRRVGGIYLLGGTTGVEIRNNTVRKCGYVGIWLIGAPKCRIIGNTVLDNRGTHANAITVYNGSNDVLVFGNRVRNSQISVSIEKIKNVTFACNDFVSPGYAVVNWYESDGVKFYNNVILSEQKKGLHLGLRDTTNCVVKNNILGGLLISEPCDVSNNLYVSHYQGVKKLAERFPKGAVVETDLKKIFVDPDNHDYRLKPGSPAIDAGVDVGLKTDGTDRPVPEGKAVDLGAYEYRPPQKR
jgi:parallel beta-helix repeat protein